MVGRELAGEKVNLRPLRDDDLWGRVEWLNDAEILKLFTGTVPSRTYSISDAERWRRNLEADISTIVWAIDTKTGRHIGDIDLHSIDHGAHTAKLTILIGDRAFWNDGYGSDTIRTVLLFAFLSMSLWTLTLRVYDFNLRAVRCYERCGFKRIDPGQPGKPDAGEIRMAIHRESLVANYPNAFSISR